VFGADAVVQRCTWHKRENVVSYLSKAQQDVWRAKLQRAWRLPTYEAAWAELRRLHQELKRVSEDAARSLAEGLEETLTLHRPGVAEALGGSLGTTNCLESILSQVERRVRRVSRWISSDQKRRSMSRGASGRRTQAATGARISGSPAAGSCLAESHKAGV
jgi:putative transposase